MPGPILPWTQSGSLAAYLVTVLLGCVVDRALIRDGLRNLPARGGHVSLVAIQEFALVSRTSCTPWRG